MEFNISILKHKLMDIKYGTSGFRYHSNIIFSIAKKIGKSIAKLSLQHNMSFGIMITASHNSYHYNGVKIVDTMGDMIDRDKEYNLEIDVNHNIDSIKIDKSLLEQKNYHTIFVGRDTRDSGYSIFKEIEKGIHLISEHIQCLDLGIVSTPEHHFLVHHKNKVPYLSLYNNQYTNQYNRDIIHVDCANGVGYLVLEKLSMKHIITHNTDVLTQQSINHLCGSDYVLSNSTLNYKLEKNTLGCSLDGDADRIIYYFRNSDDKLCILDGDYIAILYITFLIKHVKIDTKQISVGYVFSPYTNKKIVSYMKTIDNHIHCECAGVGVKKLIAKSKQYDICVYFESNGHGSIVYNLSKIKTIQNLDYVLNINNMIVGDGINSIFLVKYMLSELKYDHTKWYSLVHKNPFELYKIRCRSRFSFVTTKTEDRLIEPYELQDDIDHLIKTHTDNNLFIFVRPSGTENVIRIYIESDSETLNQEIKIKMNHQLFNYIL